MRKCFDTVVEKENYIVFSLLWYYILKKNMLVLLRIRTSTTERSQFPPSDWLVTLGIGNIKHIPCTAIYVCFNLLSVISTAYYCVLREFCNVFF